MSRESREGAFEGIACGLMFLLIFAIIVTACSGGIQLIQVNHKEMQDKRTEIEGVVVKVESYIVPEPKEEPPPDDGKKRTTIKIGPGHVAERTKITFQDGRSKEFNGVMSKPLENGKYYIITYNGYNFVVEIKEKN